MWSLFRLLCNSLELTPLVLHYLQLLCMYVHVHACVGGAVANVRQCAVRLQCSPGPVSRPGSQVPRSRKFRSFVNLSV